MGNAYQKGPSDLGSNAMKGYPLQFHATHSDHVQLSADKRRANRVESFCKGICFSNRSVAINERVYIKFSDVSTSWSGVVRFGFTSCNPATINSAELPRYACPDLTNKPGYWAKALPERFAEKDTVLFFYVTRGGDVMYGVNGEENGLFFSGVSTNSPIWALIDIYGNTISVEFVDGYQLNNVSAALMNNGGNLSTSCSPGSSVTTTATTIQQDNWQNASIPSPQIGTPMTLQSNFSAAPPSEIAPPLPRVASQNAHYTPLPFHSTIGRNVCLSPDKTIAVRLKHEYCNGYVFSHRPMRCGETLVIQILSIMPVGDGLDIGGLAFGMTACDPASLKSEHLPDDSDMLLDRPEYWIVNKDVCAKPKVGDELSFLLTHQGEVRYGKNGHVVATLMHYDKTLPMWMFFDVFGNTQKIKSHGILNNTAQSPSSAGPSSRLTVSLPPPRPPQPDIVASTTVVPPRPPPPHQRALPSVPATPPSLPPKQYKSAPQLLPQPMVPAAQAPLQLRHCHSGASITASLPPPLIPTPVSTNPFLSSPVEPMSLPPNIQLQEALTTKMVLMPAASGGSLTVMQDGWSEEAADNATNECSVCFEKAVDCVLYTCGHMCLCYECAIDIKNNQNALCPICRQEIKDVIKTYRS